jgi:hypothetical protein
MCCPLYTRPGRSVSCLTRVQVKQAMAAGRTVVLLNHDNMCVQRWLLCACSGGCCVRAAVAVVCVQRWLLCACSGGCCVCWRHVAPVCRSVPQSRPRRLTEDSYESLYDVLNQRYVVRRDPQTGVERRMLRLGARSVR